MERLQESHSVLGWNDSRGVLLSRDGTTPGESFSPGMKRLQRGHSVFGWNDSRKLLLSRDGTTFGESIHPRTEGLQRSHSVLGLNDSRGIILSGIERLHGSYSFLDGATLGSHSVLEWNDSRGVLQSWNRTSPGESFCYGMERLEGSISVLGSNVSSGVILS